MEAVKAAAVGVAWGLAVLVFAAGVITVASAGFNTITSAVAEACQEPR